MLANLGSVPVSVEIKMVLALFAVGDVYASLCKRGAYTSFSTLLRLRAPFWL